MLINGMIEHCSILSCSFFINAIIKTLVWLANAFSVGESSFSLDSVVVSGVGAYVLREGSFAWTIARFSRSV